ncbi:spermine oxidase-like isoform X2 [Athalia rosae]|uniref:spermine oxidase-like isoform X2 n=1 Tax=Athalia rosae TaxID=37344 RepID=UPI002033760D|nr:spermine oxidase-like isoform X2 [Athalia rosae]
MDVFIDLISNPQFPSFLHKYFATDNVIELGAEWVHGEHGNVSHKLAAPYNLLESSKALNDTSTYIFIDSQGNHIPKTESTQLLDLYHDIHSKLSENIKKFRGSYGEYFSTKYHGALGENPITDPIRASQFLEWIHRYENIIECSDSWYDTSAQGLTEYHTCPGDPLLNWKGKGYKTLFDLLMCRYAGTSKALPVREKIQFNKVVSNIDYNSMNEIIVKTEDNSHYVADHVICTASLGVLKAQHKTLFTPPLPEIKQSTIQGLNIGTVDKIFLEFPYTWWPDGTAGFNLIWSQEDKNEFLQSFGQENKWLTEFFHISTVDHQPRVLSGWLTGPTARYMENLPDAVVVEGFYKILQKFLSGTYNVPRPLNMMRSSWHKNKHFRGCYSFRSLESDRLNVWAKNLAEPITGSNDKPVILFGGEATHEHYYSTVHGAIETGFREADRLSNYYRERKCHL